MEIGDILGIIFITALVIVFVHGIALILSIISMILNYKDKINILNLVISIIGPIINYEVFALFGIPIINIIIILFVLIFSIINLSRNIKIRKPNKEEP